MSDYLILRHIVLYHIDGPSRTRLIPVSGKSNSFCASLRPAIQQQKLLSGP